MPLPNGTWIEPAGARRRPEAIAEELRDAYLLLDGPVEAQTADEINDHVSLLQSWRNHLAVIVQELEDLGAQDADEEDEEGA